MKKLCVLLLIAIWGGIFAQHADVIIPPINKTVKVSTKDKLTAQSGAFEIDFSLNFTNPKKDYIGYMLNCRNWVKPFQGFAFGVNRVKNKSSIWFYPLDTDGKVFGFYRACTLENNKRYKAVLSYEGRHCVLKIDGKVVVDTNLKQPITVYKDIEIGGMGGKTFNVTVHSFKFLSKKKSL